MLASWLKISCCMFIAFRISLSHLRKLTSFFSRFITPGSWTMLYARVFKNCPPWPWEPFHFYPWIVAGVSLFFLACFPSVPQSIYCSFKFRSNTFAAMFLWNFPSHWMFLKFIYRFSPSNYKFFLGNVCALLICVFVTSFTDPSSEKTLKK